MIRSTLSAPSRVVRESLVPHDFVDRVRRFLLPWCSRGISVVASRRLAHSRRNTSWRNRPPTVSPSRCARLAPWNISDHPPFSQLVFARLSVRDRGSKRALHRLAFVFLAPVAVFLIRQRRRDQAAARLTAVALAVFSPHRAGLVPRNCDSAQARLCIPRLGGHDGGRASLASAAQSPLWPRRARVRARCCRSCVAA